MQDSSTINSLIENPRKKRKTAANSSEQQRTNSFLKKIAFLVCLLFSQTMIAQHPSDYGSLFTPGDTPDDFIGNPPSTECESPRLLELSFVYLNNGQVLFEAIFDTNFPLPSDMTNGNHHVYLVGDNTSSVRMNGPVGTDENIYRASMRQGVDNFTILAWNPCEERSYDEVYSGSAECGDAINFPVSAQFDADLAAYLDNEDSFSGYREFLNSLPYLTSIQRFAFYQSMITADCLPVPPIFIGGGIPDEYGPSLGECHCSKVVIRRNGQLGTIPDQGFGDASADGAGQTGDISDLQNGTNAWGNDFGKGAAKWADNHLNKHGGNGDTEANEASTGSTTDPTRTSRIRINLVCSQGDLPSYCGCSRTVDVDYRYDGEIKAFANLGPSVSAKKKAEGYAIDGCFLSVSRAVSNGPDEVTIHDMSIDGVAMGCEADINPEFISGAVSVLAGIGSIISATATGGSSTAVIALFGKIYGATAVDKTASGLTDLLTNPPVSRVGECGLNRKVHTMSGSISSLVIEPNKQVGITLGSIERVGAKGIRAFYSYGQAASAYRLAVHVPTSDDSAPIWCCSENGASWISNSYISIMPEPTLRAANRTWLELFGYDSDPALWDANDAGIAIMPSETAACNDVIIDALVLNPEDPYTIEVYDLSGRLVLQLDRFEYNPQSSLAIPDGVYIVLKRTKDGIAHDVAKTSIINQRLLSYE